MAIAAIRTISITAIINNICNIASLIDVEAQGTLLDLLGHQNGPSKAVFLFTFFCRVGILSFQIIPFSPLKLVYSFILDFDHHNLFMQSGSSSPYKGLFPLFSVLCLSVTVSFWRGFESSHWFYSSLERIWCC